MSLMNSVDVVTNALSTMKFPISVLVEHDQMVSYIVVNGIRHPHKLFGSPSYTERIGRIESDHVFMFAYDYEIITIPLSTEIVDGEEIILYLADPEFFKKLELAVTNHIQWLSDHKI